MGLRLNWLWPVPTITAGGEELRLRKARGGGLDCGLDLETEAVAARLSGVTRPAVAVALSLDQELRRRPGLNLHLVALGFREPQSHVEARRLKDKLSFRAMAANPAAAIRKWAAESCQEPEVLATLAHDQSLEVVRKVAGNRFLPPGLIAQLCFHADQIVREMAANNCGLDAEGVERLSHHADLSTARQACFTEHATWEMVQRLSPDSHGLVSVALFSASAQVLIRLSERRSLKIRSALAQNHHLPPEVQKVLARDPDATVRRKLAQNIIASLPEVLLEMASDNDPAVRQMVAGNLKTPAEAMNRFPAGDEYAREILRQSLSIHRRPTRRDLLERWLGL